MLFSFSNLVEVSLGGGSRINVCSTSLNFLNTHQPVRDCIYGSNTISVKKIFVGQIQPWSYIVCIYWSYTISATKYMCWSNTTLVRYCIIKIDTKNKPFSVRPIFLILKLDLFFNTKDFGHKGLPLKRNSSKMRGKKALGLICGWPSLGGWKEMTSDMAQVTKQGSEVNIKCLQSTKCKISSSFPVYSAFLLLFLKISEQGNVNYQKVFLLIIFKLHFRVLVLCSKYQPEIILLS